MHRRIKTYLDRLHPDLVQDFQDKQETFLSNQLAKGRYRFYSPQDPVFIQNFNKGVPWIPATVEEPSGPVSYKTLTPSGDIVRRHIDQMRDRVPADHSQPTPVNDETSPDAQPCSSPVLVEQSPSASGSELKNDDKTPVRPRRTITRPKHLEDFILT